MSDSSVGDSDIARSRLEVSRSRAENQRPGRAFPPAATDATRAGGARIRRSQSLRPSGYPRRQVRRACVGVREVSGGHSCTSYADIDVHVHTPRRAGCLWWYQSQKQPTAQAEWLADKTGMTHLFARGKSCLLLSPACRN